jgi:hypothetical protein
MMEGETRLWRVRFVYREGDSSTEGETRLRKGLIVYRLQTVTIIVFSAMIVTDSSVITMSNYEAVMYFEFELFQHS